MSIGNVGGAQPINMISLEGLDLESMIMAVQTNRVNVMDEQIKSKMEVVQARNAKISELNANMSGMNAAVAKCGTAADSKLADAGATAAFLAAAPQVPDTAAMERRTYTSGTIYLDSIVSGNDGTTYDRLNDTIHWANSKNIPVPPELAQATSNYQEGVELPAGQATLLLTLAATVSSSIKADQTVLTKADPKAAECLNRGQAEAYVKSLQTQIDSLGNTQQMDMLNLQSTSNKRNEAFEIMTNFMKKFNDSRAGIIQKF
jgi:hypothetical protein